MRKKFCELLDTCGDPNMDPERSAPLSSERIKELTMNQIKGAAPKKRHITFRVVLVAAIIITLAVSVYAVSSGSAWFQAFFAEQNGADLMEEQLEFLEQNAVSIDQSQTVDGYTIHVESAINDGRTIYIKLSLFAPEGEVLPYGDSRHFDALGLYNSDAEQISCGWGLEEIIDGDKTDNHVEMLMTFELEEGAAAESLLPEESVRLELTNLYKTYGRFFSQTTELMAEGSWQFDLQFAAAQEEMWEYEVIHEPVSCMMTKEATQEETEIFLTSVCLRALTIDVVYDYPDGADMERLYWRGMKVIGKDGSAINVMPSGGSICPEEDKVTGYMTLEPSAPIVLEDVAYIQFPGGTQIPVNSEE